MSEVLVRASLADRYVSNTVYDAKINQAGEKQLRQVRSSDVANNDVADHRSQLFS